MKDFSTALLIHILRATIECMEQAPGLDHTDPSVRQFEGMLLDEIVKLPEQNSPRMLSI